MCPLPGPNETLQRSLRLTPAEVAQVLDELDAAQAGQLLGPSLRFPYRLSDLRVHIHGSPSATFAAPSRRIGSTGFTFLHGCLLYQGTHCDARLLTLHGMWHDVQGVVCNCVYVRPHVYEVEVQLHDRIDPSIYSLQASVVNVLLVDDDRLMQRVLTTQLSKLNTNIDQAANGREACEKALARPFDLTLMDVEMPVLDGVEAVRALRAAGYRRRVVAMSARRTASERDRCRAAGFDEFVPKPIPQAELERLLRSSIREPIFSTFMDDESMHELIREFVEQLAARTAELQAAVARNDLDALQRAIRTLRAQGASFGFEPISTAAEAIENALHTGAAFETVAAHVQRLVDLCAQARPPGA